MPHHGSIRNLDSEGDFLQRVTSKNYVFSGNGQHGNPDRESLELLLKVRAGAEMHLHFTYPFGRDLSRATCDTRAFLLRDPRSSFLLRDRSR